MPNAKECTSSEAGYTALEMMVCLAVMLQMLILAAKFMKRNTDCWEYSMAARHLSLVGKAAGHYAQDHLEEILKSTQNSDGFIELDLEMLQNLGYLPPNFLNQNIFQQVIKVRLDALQLPGGGTTSEKSKLLRGLVYATGGQSLSDTAARSIADAIGGEGGYLPQPKQSQGDEDGPGGAPDSVLIGSCGGWSLELPEVEDLLPGHPVMLFYVNELDVLSADNFLRRVKVLNTGRYNVMQTHLGVEQGAQIQFLESGAAEVDPANQELTSIKAKELRLGKGAYWTETEGLVLENGDYKLQIQPEKMVFQSGGSGGKVTSKMTLSSEGLGATQNSNETSLSFSGLQIKEGGKISSFSSDEWALSSDGKLKLLPEKLEFTYGSRRTTLGIDLLSLYDSRSNSLFQYDPLQNNQYTLDNRYRQAWPQFIVRSGSGGKRWFAVGFNPTQSSTNDNDDRLEFADYNNRKLFLVGLFGAKPYINSMPDFPKPPPELIVQFDGVDSPYIYVVDDRDGKTTEQRELVLSANSAWHVNWYHSHDANTWEEILYN